MALPRIVRTLWEVTVGLLLLALLVLVDKPWKYFLYWLFTGSLLGMPPFLLYIVAWIVAWAVFGAADALFAYRNRRQGNSVTRERRIADVKGGVKDYAPTIKAFSEANDKILRSIAVTMLKRDEDQLDVIVADNGTGLGLAFEPVSHAAQNHLEQEQYGSEWWVGALVLEHPKAVPLIEEMERRGYRLGVRLGYKPTRSEKLLQWVHGLLVEPWYLFACFSTVIWMSLMFLKFGEVGWIYSALAGILTTYLAKRPVRALRGALQARLEKIHAARIESWKRSLIAG